MRRFPLFLVIACVASLVLMPYGAADVSTVQPPSKPAKQKQKAPQESPRTRSTFRPSLLRRLKQSGLSATEKKWVAENCQFGQPESIAGADLGPIKTIARKGYVLGHSSLSKIPYWVCEHLSKAELSGPGDRDKSRFKPDPKLSGDPRSELSDYKGSGYDRGHMSAAANNKATQIRMNESFFLSNMVPQVGATYNRGIWKKLEERVRDWVKARDECWIISGPMFYDPLEENEATADGLVEYEVIGDGEVAVPTHCFKIVLSRSGDKWEAIAFVLANKRYGRPYRLSLFRTTVDWIEERTGLDFFPSLSTDPTRIALMNELESKKSAMWERE